MKFRDVLRSESERTLAAMRYRRDGDALGFVCETHQELMPRPPSGRRTLVLFAHFDAQGVVDPYVAYYLRALYGLGATIIFVSGSPTLTPESVALIREFCAGIYTRRTLSLDFGSWHLAWCILRQHGWSLDQFDRLVIANDSVYGPLFPIEEMWSSFHDADMYGAIESTELLTSHLQSFFLAWDLNSRTRPFLNDFWNGFQYVVHKRLLIWNYEVGLSKRARRAGLSIKPFVSAGTIKETYRRSPQHQWASRFSGVSLNNTIYFWDGLIEHLRFPFLKTVLPRYNTPWHQAMANLPEFLAQHTSYPYELIESNLARLGCGESAWVKPARRTVLADRLVDAILDLNQELRSRRP
ncbi:rhamnan synthesis F family protein [Mycobacterium sp.]|uniref:rhamnan synthesis F family protein n=1 Tax=Mycobacterium sp. TaxID=1785 RepID=UPI003BADAE08